MRLKTTTCLIWLAGFMLGLHCTPVSVTPCYALLAIIQIDHSDPVDMTNAVSVLLSPEGTLSFDRRTRSLIVNDTPQVIAQVKELVERLDRPSPGLKIRVRLDKNRVKRTRELAVDGRVSGPGWSAGTKGREEDGIDVTFKQEKAGARHESEYVVKGQSGRAAYIVTGRDIPFTSRWVSVCDSFGGCRNQTTYQRVETGFEVLPVVRGQRVLVSITPRISSYAAGIIRFAGAATQITVPFGRWVDIGMVAGSTNAAVNAVIDSSTGDKGESVSIWMMIEKDKF